MIRSRIVQLLTRYRRKTKALELWLTRSDEPQRSLYVWKINELATLQRDLRQLLLMCPGPKHLDKITKAKKVKK